MSGHPRSFYASPAEAVQAPAEEFLYVACLHEGTGVSKPDFLAVVDADPRSAGYASVVATLPVGATGTRPHHTEYAMPAGGVLWANGFDASRTFAFDLRQPDRPTLSRTFSFAR